MFTKIPRGLNVRRLDERRLAQHQKHGYKYSACWTGFAGVVYGNSLREVISKAEAYRMTLDTLIEVSA